MILDDFKCDPCDVNFPDLFWDKDNIPHCGHCYTKLRKLLPIIPRHGSWACEGTIWSKYEKKNVENGFGPGGDINWKHPRWKNEDPSDSFTGKMGSGETVGLTRKIQKAAKDQL